jgi:beta-mannanase
VEKEMKKLLDLGFKKVKGTEKGFVMYELNPAELGSRQRIHDNLKAEKKEYNKTKKI